MSRKELISVLVDRYRYEQLLLETIYERLAKVVYEKVEPDALNDPLWEKGFLVGKEYVLELLSEIIMERTDAQDGDLRSWAR